MLPLYGIEACNFFCKVMQKGGLLRLFSLILPATLPPVSTLHTIPDLLNQTFFIDTDQHLFNESILVSTGYFQYIA